VDQFCCEEIGRGQQALQSIDAICKICGSGFSYPKGGGRLRHFCSTSCKKTWQLRQQQRYRAEGRKHRRPGYDQEYWSSIKQPKSFSCLYCGSEFFSKQLKASYCSKLCSAAGIAKKLEASSIATTHRTCGKCGALFRPYRSSRDQKRRGQFQRFCSTACGHRPRRSLDLKARTGANRRRRRIGGVDPMEVLERDGWRCHLCGIETPKRLRGTTDPRAPEVDHIDPIAAGGDHSMVNTACACRKCNLEKGATPKGQLRLFG
jgi:hypothetical protein